VRLFLITVLAAVVLGCQAGIPQQPVLMAKDGIHVAGTVGYEVRGGQRVKVVYTKDGTGVCDYANDFIGPLPYGHCREDGTGCHL